MVKVEVGKMIPEIQTIIYGIAAKLEELFEFEIYIEEVEQHMETPCFFITLLNAMIESGLTKSSTESLFLDVQYFNDLKSKSKNLDFLEVQQRLLREMEYISVEGKIIKLNNRKTQKVNDILHYFFDVDIRFMAIKAETKMKTLEKEGGINE